MSPVASLFAGELGQVGEWLLIIAGLGIGIGVVVGTVRWGWALIQDLGVDWSGHSSVRENRDLAERDERGHW